MTGTWFAGWATGDIVTAAEYRKGAGSIFDTILGASAATIDITSIPQSYAHLMVTLYARGDAAVASVPCWMRFNGDAGANYDYQLFSITGNAPVGQENYALTQLVVAQLSAASAPANLFAAAQVFIPHYANAVNQKSFNSVASTRSGTSAGSLRSDQYGGGWRSTAAINRITLLPSSGNFVAGTRLTVHALGA